MIQIKRYSMSEVFAAMDAPGRRATLSDGVTFRPGSARLVLFKAKGVKCVRCDVEGKFFILETQHESVPPHLNLYGEDADGELVLMTKDHILPKSKGGANHFDNYQTMCTVCNGKKSNTLEDGETMESVEIESPSAA